LEIVPDSGTHSARAKLEAPFPASSAILQTRQAEITGSTAMIPGHFQD